ncbi:hypothetical protein D9756_011417 [Leucocoprinus leucothites]|uniref:Uncharacterized protein n=1 Tax=Leucocoprinus leucothites TaxID=201217 RepID=A0A8H5CPZ9_9AGAR|nr:hypothetical protein D9756_011417 [Leucoagaricus leucothites]
MNAFLAPTEYSSKRARIWSIGQVTVTRWQGGEEAELLLDDGDDTQSQRGRLQKSKASLSPHHWPPALSSIADIPGSLPGPTLINDGTDLSVPEVLQQGTEMLKISDKNEKHVVFRLNPDSGHISYQSRKHGIGWSRVLRSQAPIDPYLVPIEAIKEIRTGGNMKYDRQ